MTDTGPLQGNGADAGEVGGEKVVGAVGNGPVKSKGGVVGSR